MATATHKIEVQCDSSAQYDVELQRVIDAGFTLTVEDELGKYFEAQKTTTP